MTQSLAIEHVFAERDSRDKLAGTRYRPRGGHSARSIFQRWARYGERSGEGAGRGGEGRGRRAEEKGARGRQANRRERGGRERRGWIEGRMGVWESVNARVWNGTSRRRANTRFANGKPNYGGKGKRILGSRAVISGRSSETRSRGKMSHGRR